MKPLILCLILASVGSLMSADGNPESEKMINRSLKIKLPATVDSVVWSIGNSRCIVQLNFPAVRIGESAPEPSTQVWLLKLDGMTILPSGKPIGAGTGKRGSIYNSINYGFPASAADEAIAVVSAIDGHFIVEPIPHKQQR